MEAGRQRSRPSSSWGYDPAPPRSARALNDLVAQLVLTGDAEHFGCRQRATEQKGAGGTGRPAGEEVDRRPGRYVEQHSAVGRLARARGRVGGGLTRAAGELVGAGGAGVSGVQAVPVGPAVDAEGVDHLVAR